MSELILHIIKASGSTVVDISVNLDDDIKVIRQKLAEKENTKPESIIIISNGTTLRDGSTVRSTNLRDRSNIRYIVKGARPVPVKAPADKIATNIINLCFNFYEGHSYNITVKLNATWAEVKKLLEEKSGTPASELRLIHAQQELFDDVRVIQSNVMDASRIFCVLKPNTHSHIEKVLNESNLKCTCPYCETQGATIAVRPYCGKCNGECMVYDDPSQMKMGSASWKTLLRVNGKCINSSCVNYNVSERCAFAVICTSCPPAIRVQRHRLIDIPSNCTENMLSDQLSKLYGYAHLNGALE